MVASVIFVFCKIIFNLRFVEIFIIAKNYQKSFFYLFYYDNVNKNQDSTYTAVLGRKERKTSRMNTRRV